jgi:hypothetical protein
MFSRGADNGDVVDAYAVNDGNFVEEPTVAITWAIGVAPKATRRCDGVSAIGASFTISPVATRRQKGISAIGWSIGITPVAVRRLKGISAIGFSFAVVPVAYRRAVAASQVTFSFSIAATLNFNQLAPAIVGRSVRVEPSLRSVAPALQRPVLVPASNRVVAVAPDARRAA